MTNLTGRTALAGAVGVPLAPITTYANGEDAAVAAYRVWRAATEADISYIMSNDDWETPEARALYDQQWHARLALAGAIATTSAGLAGQVRLAFAVFGDLKNDAYGESPDDYGLNREFRFMRIRISRKSLAQISQRPKPPVQSCYGSRRRSRQKRPFQSVPHSQVAGDKFAAQNGQRLVVLGASISDPACVKTHGWGILSRRTGEVS